MLRQFVGLAVASTILFAGQAAMAQTTPGSGHRVYVVAGGGGGQVVPDESGASEFSGPVLNGGVGAVFGRHLFIEGLVDQFRYRRNDWPGWKGALTAGVGRVGYLFGRPERVVNAYIAGSFAIGRDSYQHPASFLGEPSEILRDHESFSLWGINGGAEVKVTPRVFIRPEVGVVFFYPLYVNYVREGIGIRIKF